MRMDVNHEARVYTVEVQGNEIIMYKNDTNKWMGDIEYIKVFTIEGNTPNPVSLYRKLAKAAKQVIHASNKKWFMYNVTDHKRASLYERFSKTLKGFTFQRADRYFYVYKDITH